MILYTSMLDHFFSPKVLRACKSLAKYSIYYHILLNLLRHILPNLLHGAFFRQKLTRVGGLGNIAKISDAICSKSNTTILKNIYAYYHLPAQTQYFKKFHSQLVLLLLLRERHSCVRHAAENAKKSLLQPSLASLQRVFGL